MSLDLLFLYPLLAASLMALVCSLVGSLLFVSRRLLVGEALSHAAYPGAILAALVLSAEFGSVMIGAAIAAFVGKFLIEWMVKKRGTSVDSALCFVLSSFFGFGVLLASYMQNRAPLAYKQALVFLFGQVATMTEFHVIVYAILAAGVLLVLFLLFKEFTLYSFDAIYARSLAFRAVPYLIALLTVIAIIISIRSVGVILLSAMLIAPATAARQWSRRFSTMVMVSALIGIISSLAGAYYSIYADLPTGPVMALVASLLALLSLLLAPKRGLIAKVIQRERFAWKCRQENSIKALYKGNALKLLGLSSWQQSVVFFLLHWKKQVKRGVLTAKGEAEALRVIRLHRLFELYLTKQVGLDKENVHKIAEDAEHYISHELEQEIDKELDYPESDPHKQPIPKRPL